MDATAKDLPAAVREQPADKTSVYQAGQLVYDGATGERHGSAAGGADGAPRGPGGTLNEMLQWGIANSDPAELERRAGAGAAPPTRVDQEILDHILGQPTVAGMRANLGKLEPDAIESDGGVEAAVAALEALEFDVECVDNANDLAKIGGVQAMLALCARAHRQPDLAEMACAVLATCMQNNPTCQAAAVELGVPSALLSLITATDADAGTSGGEGSGSGGTDDSATGAVQISVRRAALSALSALARGSPDIGRAVFDPPAASSALGELLGENDPKLRRRATFLARALAADGALPHAALASLAAARGLARSLTDADESVREEAAAVVGAAPAPLREGAAEMRRRVDEFAEAEVSALEACLDRPPRLSARG